MKLYSSQLYALGTSLIFWLLTSGAATAQIIPDNTLSNNSSVPRNCNNCEITGGTRAGNNLFHSFRQFSVPTGGRAYFDNAASIRNIFARVTGRASSVIDGILQTNRSANLFLLNPNGILFGRNAALNLGGSFFAITADRINFADGTQFSATQPQTSPLLTVSTPVGLQFGRNPGAVANQSQLEVLPSQTLALLGNGIFLANGSLIAKSGRIELGSVAPSSFVSLTPDNESYTLTYTNLNLSDIELLDRSAIDTSGIATSSLIDDRNGGAVQLQGRDIRITEGSGILSQTYEGTGAIQQIKATQALTLNSASMGTATRGRGRAGDIVVHADSLELQTGANRSFLASQAGSGSSGRAGNLAINTNRLAVRDGSRIEASTFGEGGGGNIAVNASTIEVTGFYPRARDFNEDDRPERRGQITSSISSQSEKSAGVNAGDAGRLTIQTDHLVLSDGGLISTATFAGGNSGNIRITAADILISGASPAVTRNQYRSGIFVSAEPRAIGRVGELDIRADQLTLDDRAQISARNRGMGQPGVATITVGELNIQDGSEISASTEQAGQGGMLFINADTIRITGTGRFRTGVVPSSISALSTENASGRAGDLQVNASTLKIEDNAILSVSGEGSGAAGNLTIDADRILLNRGSVEASTQAGNGAVIALQDINLLMLRNGSEISARAFNDANGGNITIQTPNGYLIADVNQNNDIIANASAGDGGEITVDARGIIGLEQRLSTPPNQTNDIDASSEQGAQGIVTITQPNVDPSQGLIELPSTVVDASNLITQTCPTGGTINATDLSEFIITGRGGLPPSPTDPRDDDALLTDWATLEEERRERLAEETGEEASRGEIEYRETIAEEKSRQEEAIVEAQGWIMDANGTVVLTAQRTAILPHRSTFMEAACNL